MSSCAVSRNASVTPEIDYGTYSLGVSLSLFASVGINFGNNVQALGLQRLAAADDPATQRKWKRVWLIGTVTFICSALLNFVAFAFGPYAMPCMRVPRAPQIASLPSPDPNPSPHSNPERNPYFTLTHTHTHTHTHTLTLALALALALALTLTQTLTLTPRRACVSACNS